MEDCIFCKISKEEIASYKVYEDGNFFAFLDINPRNKGHTLVIPKEHRRWVWDVDNVGDYMEVCKVIAIAIKNTFETDNVSCAILGEEVPHAHIHLIPRFPKDGHGGALDFSVLKSFTDAEMKEFATMISQNIKK
jgi:histidine triad (HIT) family protein